MDIRRDISEILKKYGHEAIYIRRNKKFRCDCYSERSGGQSYDNCPKCFGTGYAVTIEKIRTRRQISSVPESLVRARKQYEHGYVAANAYVYYLEQQANPKDGDLILEVDWRNGVPVSVNEKNIISVGDPLRGSGGRIEFYKVYSRFEPTRKSDNNAITYH
ncbi:MAG: hypothetical protein IJ880_03990 [Bacilli bacterium]|nr:hypothetical protein [Bacilli bacterium]MBR3119846.1 hypothetical protein [Oceanobacillus sp.]